MKMPKSPPKFDELLAQEISHKRVGQILQLAEKLPADDYLHWDELRRRPPPEGIRHEQWWLALKLKRKAANRTIPLLDKTGQPFTYFITDKVQELLHEIDFGAGAYVGMPEPIVNPQTRDRYIVSSLIQEAITSSQLEGAVTTREVANDMLRSGRPPRDDSERMILNNYLTMQEIIRIKDQPLSVPLLLDIHRMVTSQALKKPDAAGRFRRSDEPVHVVDGEGNIYHAPPDADELQTRAEKMCAFANGQTPGPFVPPVIRAILLHFWLAYDHPFYDGNGRTARALFYWSMLHHHFWLFEFISISSIILKARTQYARAFLYTESDENDLNYFILHQADVIRRAVTALHDYLGRKQQEQQTAATQLRSLRQYNHQQQALLMHALRHAGAEYSIESHKASHAVAYATARSDLLTLEKAGLLTKAKRGKEMFFEPGFDLLRKLEAISKKRPAPTTETM
ncbi:MAG: Fic family protein [Kiritimatiellia bacterium]|nr:Fic family protein [Kiritimatiellia bacterium]